MPVHRFRSVTEMPSPGRGDERDLASRIRALWNRAFLLCPALRRPGVRRFRSIGEANEDRRRSTLERMRRTRSSGLAGGA